MHNYKMIWRTSVATVSWEYDFQQPSNALAIEYATRHLEALAKTGCGIMGLDLFRDDRDASECDNPPDWKSVVYLAAGDIGVTVKCHWPVSEQATGGIEEAV